MLEKLCSKCKVQKSVKDFNKAKKSPDGLQSQCRVCSNLGNKIWQKLNPEKVSLKSKRWYNNNPEKVKDLNLRTKYGITLKQYNELYSKQNGRCGICGKSQEELKEVLCVDHDHKTGKVRGLLCDAHNKALGLFNDNPVFLLSSVKYLECTANNEVVNSQSNR